MAEITWNDKETNTEIARISRRIISRTLDRAKLKAKRALFGGRTGKVQRPTKEERRYGINLWVRRSAPGEAPAEQTKRLRHSIRSRVNNSFRGVLLANVQNILESKKWGARYGKRPLLEPACLRALKEELERVRG